MAKRRGRRISVEIEGTKELEKAFARLGKQASEHLEESVLSGAEIIRQSAIQKAPYKTGNLRGNIEKATSLKSFGRVEVDIGPNRKAWYAHFLEYGTSKMPAKPFLRPAIDENRDTASREILGQLKSIIERLWNK